MTTGSATGADRSTVVNPYRLVGQVAEGERFIGRGGLITQVQSVWREPGRPSNLRVLGNHRMGKTSLVRQAVRTCPERASDLLTIWLNVGSHDSGTDLFRAMTRRVMEELREPERAASLPAGPTADLAPIDMAVQKAGTWYDISEAVRDFFKAVRRAGLSVLLILDEFDRAATTFKLLAEFQLLRDLASDPLFSLGLITVSRRDIESIEIATAGGSILGGVVATRRYVGMFTDEEADLMLARAASSGIGLASYRSAIMERSGAHPFLLEVLCNRIVEIHGATGETLLERAYEEESGTFEAQFAQLLQNINSDSDGRGGSLLRRIASGIGPDRPSLDLNRLKLTGVVKAGAEPPEVFSREFARYLQLTAAG